MRKEEVERRLHELRKKYVSLVSSMQMAKAQKVRNKIEALERELEPHSLGEMLQDYTPEFKVEMLKKMHRLFVYSDLLEGAVLDFQYFGNMCDEINLVVSNIINKYLAK